VLPTVLQKAKGAFVSESALHSSMAISRILSGRRGDLMIIHLIRPARGTNARPRRCGTVMRRYPRIFSGPAALPLFCLAPHGVFRASRIAPRAVSSYLAFSPLPALSQRTGGMFSVTLSVNIRPALAGRMLPAYFTRHAAVWCSDFPPVSPANAGLTSDHLPSAHSLTQ
jgi:hypothetical protein